MIKCLIQNVKEKVKRLGGNEKNTSLPTGQGDIFQFRDCIFDSG